MTLSAIEQLILELARHTAARTTIMDQCRLYWDPLEAVSALAGLLGCGLIVQEHDGWQHGLPIRYTSTELGLRQLSKQKDDAAIFVPQPGFP